MNAYADSNFFTRLYLPVPGAEEAREWLEQARRRRDTPLPLTWLHRIEVVNAFQLHVLSSRIPQQTRVTAEQSAAAQAHFREDIARGIFTQKREANLATLESQFEALSLRHTSRHGFRTYDILHIATALLFECDIFWSFDAKACRLAALEGLKLTKR
jgi:predicted nucleic acid-binding protein